MTMSISSVYRPTAQSVLVTSACSLEKLYRTVPNYNVPVRISCRDWTEAVHEFRELKESTARRQE